ncbi:MAG: SGNH/GDSL hydrolase family protein [Pseudonocardiaceae bacterium]
MIERGTSRGNKASGTRRLSLCAAAVVGMVVTAAPGAASAATASQAPFPYPEDYAALGDSYSSGFGTGVYDPASGACDRSPLSYPSLWVAEHHPASFEFAACSGAETADVLATQISALRPGTNLVTITIGGNDTGFSTVLQICTAASSDRTCDAAVDAAETFARFVLPARLARTYGAIRRAAPRAHVIVLGYPRLFDLAPSCFDPFVPNQARRAKINHGGDVLDGVISDIASRQSGFSFADVRGRFAGHGVCSAEPWINGPIVPTTVGPYHPTQTGYRDGYLPALDAATARDAA